MMANDWGDLGFVPDNDDFADLGFQPDSLAQAAAEFDIDEPQKLAPLSTFWNALTQSAAEKPALMLRGATAYTPGEAAGFDKTLERVAARLSTLKDPEKRKRAELALQGHLWPARSDDPWYKVDPDLVPNVVNTLAAQLGDQIPITTATVLGRMVGKAVGSIAGIGAGVGVAMATAGPDPSDIAVSPVVAAVTRKLVEHIGGATPMVLLETGSFLQSAEWHGIDKDIAEKYATLYGPAAGAIEYVQQLWNLKALKGVAEPIKKKLLGRVLFAIGGNVFEGVEEMSQGGLERYLIGKAIEEMKARDPDFEAKKPKPFSLEESGREFAIGTIMGTMFSTGGKAVKMLQEETSRKDVTADQIQQAVDKAVTAIKDDPDLSDGQKAELLTAVERVYMKGFTAKLTAIRNNADNMVVGAGDKARQKKTMLSDLDQIVQHYKTIADEIEANKAAMPELDEIKQLLPDYEAAVKNFVKNPSEEGFGQIKALGDRIAELGAEYGENISTERAKEIGKVAAEQQQQQQQVEPEPKMDEESRRRDEELGRLFKLAMEGDEAATQKLRDFASEMVREEPTAEQLFGAEYAEEQRAKEKDADLFGIGPTEETAKKRPEEIASSLNLLKKKVHVLARNLGISDEERRAIQQRLTGKKSMAGMTPEEAKVVAEHFTKLSKEQGLSSSTGEELAESIKKNAPRKKVIERLKGLPAKILSIKRGFDLGQTRPERLLEALDGHKEGPVYRTIWMPVKRGEANARAGVNRRVTDFVDFVEKVFAKQGKVDKHAIKQFVGNAKKTFTDGKATIALTPAERIGVYLYANQEKGLHHLRYGNFKEFANPDPIIADVIRSLTPEEKAVADWMVQELGDNFDRVQDVAQKALGQKLKQESAYFGMFLQGESLEDRQDFLSLLDLLSGPHATQYVPKPGFTKERVGGATQPLNLDAFGNYISLVQRTEQFINMAMVAKRVGDIFKTQSFRQAVNNATDGHGMKNLDKWLSDCIRGYVKESNDWIDKALLILRKNAAVYLLAYNMPSAARQSAAMLTASASHPVIAAKIFQYTAICASHPSAFSEIKAEAAGKSNFMANRNFDRDVAKMRREEKAKNLLLRKKSWDQRLLALQTAVDDFSATLSWKAMYDAAMSNESVQQAFGLDGSEAAAIEFADKWVARTQTVGDVEHLPDFFRGSTMSRLFSTFMNDVNNNLNFWKHDIIGARKAGKISNSMVAYRVFTSWVLPAFMMGVLRRARLPRTWEEVVFDQAAYGLGTYFFVGDIILNSITGFSGARTGIEELALIEAGRALRSAAKEGDIAKAAWHGAKAAGASTGKIPAQLFRTSEGIYDLATGRTDDLRRLIWSEWSLEKTALGEDGDEGAGGRAVSTRARSSQSSRSGGRRTSSRR